MILRHGAIRPALKSGCRLLTVRPRVPFRSLAHYDVVEHTGPCQHTRHYPGGAEPGRHSDLRLSVKQYVPKREPPASSTAVTIIGAHGNGLPSELLEPFWDDFYEHMQSKGRDIRSIWIADQAHQGRSGVLNEQILGDDPSWFDHARDLLFFVNLMQRDMPQPLFGIGHSMGASQLVHLALLHPSLLQGLVLMDPVLQTSNPGKPYGLASTHRRDVWPSRVAAREAFAKSKFYQTWDSRVFDKWIDAGLRDLPTELHTTRSSRDDPEVTLTTAKPHEVHSFLRPLYRGSSSVSPRDDPEHYADLNADDQDPREPFYRPEPAILFRRLPEVRPAVSYITGKHSPLAGTELNEQRLETTGAGVGGSGGVAHGRVEATELDCGHFVPMEETAKSAQIAATFVAAEADGWQEKSTRFAERWHRRPRPARIDLDDTWKQRIGPRK